MGGACCTRIGRPPSAVDPAVAVRPDRVVAAGTPVRGCRAAPRAAAPGLGPCLERNHLGRAHHHTPSLFISSSPVLFLSDRSTMERGAGWALCLSLKSTRHDLVDARAVKPSTSEARLVSTTRPNKTTGS